MVRVATRQAENPMGIISKKLSLGKTGAVQVVGRTILTYVSPQAAWEALWLGMLPICHCLANWTQRTPEIVPIKR